MTAPLKAVLRDLVDHPGEFYGPDILNRTNVGAGIIYPILHRLLHAGWLTSRPEDEASWLAGPHPAEAPDDAAATTPSPPTDAAQPSTNSTPQAAQPEESEKPMRTTGRKTDENQPSTQVVSRSNENDLENLHPLRAPTPRALK
jgi:hypothetical protein